MEVDEGEIESTAGNEQHSIDLCSMIKRSHWVLERAIKALYQGCSRSVIPFQKRKRINVQVAFRPGRNHVTLTECAVICRHPDSAAKADESEMRIFLNLNDFE
jgi:hypothetical protein